MSTQFEKNFEALVKERRSAAKFIPGVEISMKELEDMLSLVKFAPSAFNLQHQHYIVVRDPEAKQKVYEATGKQYKVETASAVLVVLGNTEAYKDAARINEGLLNLGVLNKQEYEATVGMIEGFYEGRGESFKREEAIRNASLSAMLFMLIAKDRGWDTCPMIGFDPQALSASLNIPDSHVPVIMISLGKEDTSSQTPRGYRKPTGEYVSYDSF
ncbi:nitroreductase family protein [Paenibacillus sp. GCM10012307]|uniref:Nitroreductase family protein n=1 Tax=Paenibacillus roseus TaxID=2798579 RepID=A0A934MXB9_9BACL|nr:nitroreductase family protein [Paenibacillus roseus]MBJ6364032.1 nitroreductase family protein [Paenibacillus roseus]